MELLELKELWNAYDKKLDRTLKTNKSALKNLKLSKVKRKLRPIFVSRIVDLSFALAIVSLLGSYISSYIHIPFLWGNGLIILCFAIIALIGSVEQIILIKQVRYSGPVIDIRKKIEQVNKHQWFYTKLLFLSAGFWFAMLPTAIGLFFFVLSEIQGVDILSKVFTEFSSSVSPEFRDYVRLNMILNLLLLLPLGWLFMKMRYKNLHIKWVRKTMYFFTSTKTKKALAFLNEIERFEEEKR